MATLTVGQITRAGTTHTLAAAASGGDAFRTTGREFLVVANGNVGAVRTVTFAIQGSIDGQTPSGRAVEIAASTTKVIGPFAPQEYADGDGLVQVTYSDSAADLTVQALRL